MSQKKVVNLFAALAFAVALVTGLLLFTPADTTAQVYSAGNNEGANICSCPVEIGDCICKFTKVPK